MKRKNIFIYTFMLTLIASACIEDQDFHIKDIESKDRQILSYQIKGQIGPANITPIDGDSGKIVVKVLAGTDLKSVKPTGDFAISYNAKVAPSPNEAVNFDNADSTVIYTVTSESGDKRYWKVSVEPFKSDIDGKWSVDSLKFLFDVKPSQSWGWSRIEPVANYIPSAGAELDNTVSFTTKARTANGNLSGTFNHEAGADGAFGSFILEEQTDPAPPANDYTYIFRKVPKGVGEWYWDLDKNELIFNRGTEDESKLSIDFIEDGSICYMQSDNESFDEDAQVTDGSPIWKVWELTSVRYFYYRLERE